MFRIVTFRNTLIQIETNLFKNYFQPNIVQAIYNTFTVHDNLHTL